MDYTDFDQAEHLMGGDLKESELDEYVSSMPSGFSYQGPQKVFSVGNAVPDKMRVGNCIA